MGLGLFSSRDFVGRRGSTPSDILSTPRVLRARCGKQRLSPREVEGEPDHSGLALA